MVYGYFFRRCGDRGAAEDLTSETFLAAMDAAPKDDPPPISTPWLLGVARHKLADHYRRHHSAVPVTFYGHVLGWTYDPASHQVTNTELPKGISAHDGPPTLFCCYAVSDVRAARSAITAAGGSAGEIRHTDYGVLLDATDPQGVAFAVFEPPAGRKRPELNGSGPGEPSYVTYHVPDSAGFRDFYGRVLGWTFEPGRVADGWQVVGPHPMAGAAGGSALSDDGADVDGVGHRHGRRACPRSRRHRAG